MGNCYRATQNSSCFYSFKPGLVLMILQMFQWRKYQEIVVFHIYCCKCNISAATILCQIAAGHETNRLEELPNIGRSSNLAIMRFPTISCQQKYHPELFVDIKIVFFSYRIILPLQVGRASKYWKLENSLKIMQFYYCT